MWVVWVTAWADLPLAIDPAGAWDGLLYAGGLTSILLAHEFGHYVVARRHGMDQTLPFFLPLPFALGTLGAVIELKTPARSRVALLEMGAAGPLAGFLVAVGVLGLGLLGTEEQVVPLVVCDWPPQLEPGLLDRLAGALEPVARGLRLSGLADSLSRATARNEIALNILANPWLFDLLGEVLLGHPPGRFARLHPLALAGWAGCFLTGMNLLPIGQLDGGHIVKALVPKWAGRLGTVALVGVFCGGIWWPVWALWAVLLYRLGAHEGLPVPRDTPLSLRAVACAGACVAVFSVCFMAVPTEIERLSLAEVQVMTPEGRLVSADEVATWLSQVP